MKIKYVHDDNMKLTHLSECDPHKNYYCINPNCHEKLAIKNGGKRKLHPSHIGKPCTYTDSEALVYVCKKIIMEHVFSHTKGYEPPTFTIPKYDIIAIPLASRFSDKTSDLLLEVVDIQNKYYSECDLAINIRHQSNNVYNTFTIYIRFSLDSIKNEYYLDKYMGHQVLEIKINDKYIYDMNLEDLKYILIESTCDKEWKNIPTSKDRLTKHRLLESKVDIHRTRKGKDIKDCPLIPPDNSFDVKRCLDCPCLQLMKKTFIMCTASWGIFDSNSYYERIRESDNY